MNDYWKTIDGYFDFQSVYDRAVSSAVDGDIFVELGVYKGKSLCYLCSRIMESGKKIYVHGVDMFVGMNTTPGGESSSKIVLNNIRAIGATDICTLHEMPTVDSANIFENGSVKFAFIDACHEYECVSDDIKAWVVKIKPGGMLAGHDYSSRWPGVVKAVNEAFPGIEVLGNSWLKLINT